MDVKELKRLMDAMAAADVTELEFEWDGGEASPGGRVALRRGAALPAPATPLTGPRGSASSATDDPGPPAPAVAATLALGAAPAAPAGVEVVAPIVGTFYAGASPDASDFVRVGDQVKTGQVLCIIEAMKLMNEIEAEVGGTIAEILVRNEDPVEYGQPLFRIVPG